MGFPLTGRVVGGDSEVLGRFEAWLKGGRRGRLWWMKCLAEAEQGDGGGQRFKGAWK